MAKHLSERTGLNITKGGAYGGTCFQLNGGSENLTGYVTKQQAMDWAHAFLKGLSIGYTKHKRDVIATAQSPIATQEFICGDCGALTSMRYESSYEIGIAPFRWLCYTCYRAYTDATCDMYISYNSSTDKSRTCRQPATHKVLDHKDSHALYYVCADHSTTVNADGRVVPLAPDSVTA